LDEFGIEVASGMDVDEEGVEDPVREVSPVEDDSDVAKEVETIRRSSRRSSKAEKARAIEEDRNDDKGNDEGEEEKNNEAGEPREKTKGDYLPFDATKHFYWATTVSLGFLFCSCSGLFS